MFMTLKGVRGLHLCDEGVSIGRQHDATLHGRQKLDKEPPQQIRFPARSATIWASKPARIMALGGYPDYVSIHPISLHLFFVPSC
jgi:hypothetical protein